MKIFNYSALRNQKWDSDILGLIAAIYKETGKQELYLKQRPDELEKLVEMRYLLFQCTSDWILQLFLLKWAAPFLISLVFSK